MINFAIQNLALKTIILECKMTHCEGLTSVKKVSHII